MSYKKGEWYTCTEDFHMEQDASEEHVISDEYVQNYFVKKFNMNDAYERAMKVF